MLRFLVLWDVINSGLMLGRYFFLIKGLIRIGVIYSGGSDFKFCINGVLDIRLSNVVNCILLILLLFYRICGVVLLEVCLLISFIDCIIVNICKNCEWFNLNDIVVFFFNF